MRSTSLAFVAALAFCVSCKDNARPPAADAQLATDLPDPVVDTLLRNVANQGGPHAERIQGLGLGAAALPPEAAKGAVHASAQADGGAAAPAPAVASSGPAAVSGDVRWDTEPYGAIAAAAHGELLPMPANAEDVPDLWRDPSGTWVAVGGRAEVLLANEDALGGRTAPARFTALTEPWLKGKVAIVAPTGGASLAHFAALYEAWGEERMDSWLSGLKANEVQLLSTDDEVRQAVVSGKATVGIVASDEAAKAAASAAHVLVVYPNQRSIGTFVWPTALSRPKNATHPEAAARLAERLADRSTEQLLVARVPGFIPLRRDIPVPPGVRTAANLVVVSVDPARIVSEIERRKGALAAWSEGLKK